MDYEQLIMQLIVSSGEARSNSMKAIRLAREGNQEKALETLKSSQKSLQKAHEIQTDLLQQEASGEEISISLLIIHSQDHLMNAITIHDLAEEFIYVYNKI